MGMDLGMLFVPIEELNAAVFVACIGGTVGWIKSQA